ncbi:MAG: Holliday junction resolvase RuvX [Dehalococcoidia bacterium]
MRLLGIDTGEKRIGIAICDPQEIVAVPLCVLERKGRHDTEAIAGLARREAVEQLVVGLPLSLDGGRGPQAERAMRFGERLASACGLAVVFWDERFSTVEADRVMLEAGLSRRRRDARRDATAAAIILQDYIDSNRSRMNSTAP